MQTFCGGKIDGECVGAVWAQAQHTIPTTTNSTLCDKQFAQQVFLRIELCRSLTSSEPVASVRPNVERIWLLGLFLRRECDDVQTSFSHLSLRYRSQISIYMITSISCRHCTATNWLIPWLLYHTDCKSASSSRILIPVNLSASSSTI